VHGPKGTIKRSRSSNFAPVELSATSELINSLLAAEIKSELEFHGSDNQQVEAALEVVVQAETAASLESIQSELEETPARRRCYSITYAYEEYFSRIPLVKNGVNQRSRSASACVNQPAGSSLGQQFRESQENLQSPAIMPAADLMDPFAASPTPDRRYGHSVLSRLDITLENAPRLDLQDKYTHQLIDKSPKPVA
jgi:hypothetical protein